MYICIYIHIYVELCKYNNQECNNRLSAPPASNHMIEWSLGLVIYSSNLLNRSSYGGATSRSACFLTSLTDALCTGYMYMCYIIHYANIN